MPIGEDGKKLPYEGEAGYEEAKAANPKAYLLSMGERKRIGAEVTRAARAAGVGGNFTVPKGLDLAGANKWQDAAIKDIRRRSMSPEEILHDMKKSTQKSFAG